MYFFVNVLTKTVYSAKKPLSLLDKRCTIVAVADGYCTVRLLSGEEYDMVRLPLSGEKVLMCQELPVEGYTLEIKDCVVTLFTSDKSKGDAVLKQVLKHYSQLGLPVKHVGEESLRAMVAREWEKESECQC